MPTTEYVKCLWNNTDTNDIHIYIDIPFCVNQCRYCIYKGMKIDKYGDAINKIDLDIMESYAKDVIKQIENFKDIIMSKNIESIYVGGGTPNVMPVHLLKEIFNSIPGFKDIKIKVIDTNPDFIKDDFIDMLSEYKFSLITYGVQSFNKDVLDNQKRLHVSFEKMKLLYDKVNEIGINQSCDLMCYILNYNSKDLDIFEDDLKKAMKIGFDFITATPEFFTLTSSPELGIEFGKRLSSIMNENNEYFPEWKYYHEEYPIDSSWRHVNRIIKNKHKEVFSDMVVYYGNAFSAAVHPILSFGTSIGSNDVMSYVPEEFYYVSKIYNCESVFDVMFEKGK